MLLSKFNEFLFGCVLGLILYFVLALFVSPARAADTQLYAKSGFWNVYLVVEEDTSMACAMSSTNQYNDIFTFYAPSEGILAISIEMPNQRPRTQVTNLVLHFDYQQWTLFDSQVSPSGPGINVFFKFASNTTGQTLNAFLADFQKASALAIKARDGSNASTWSLLGSNTAAKRFYECYGLISRR